MPRTGLLVVGAMISGTIVSTAGQGARSLGADYSDPGQVAAPPPRPPSLQKVKRLLFILLAYSVTLLVILRVLHHLYVHTYNYTPPQLRAYRQLVEDRRLVELQRAQLLPGDNHQQQQQIPYTWVPMSPQFPRGGDAGQRSAGPTGTSSEIAPWPLTR